MDRDHVLTDKVIGLAMGVHRTLGPGFLESVYRNALLYELQRSGCSVEAEKRITVRNESVIVGDFIVDLVVNGSLICELKAIRALTKADEVQTVNYLTATGHDSALLLNFGAPSLEFKRKFRRSPEPAVPDLQSCQSC